MSNSSLSKNLQFSRSSNRTTDLYIYDIPPPERQRLCAILDVLDLWTDLAVNHMGYTRADLQSIKRAVALGNSPSEELLNMWGDQNHTVTELFMLLNRMQQFTAMDALKSLVDRKYHKLIKLDQPDLSDLLKNENCEKVLNRPILSTASDSNNESYERSSSTSNNNNNVEGKNAIESFDMRNVNEYASSIPQISYYELVEATNNWNKKQILGKGGFGTVYKGVWKYTAVAIKRIQYHGTVAADSQKVQIQQSLNELKYLNSCRHDNILPLYGYSISGEEPCLVYQLMSGGSLEQRLHSKDHSPLSWKQRLDVARGTARGLQFLHTFREKPLIHGDIKPANILLDPCTQPKIGDFGLAREGPNALNSSVEVSRVYGTRPYLPVEFLGYKTLSTKVDTYSFGVVLLELVTGLKAHDESRTHKYLTKHIISKSSENVPIESLIDSRLPVDGDEVQICAGLIQLGRICIAEKPEQRPEMATVLRHLESESN